MLSVSGISGVSHSAGVNFCSKVEKTEEVANAKPIDEEVGDSVEIKHKKGTYELTKADKQQILSKARAKAAGWSILGEFVSTIYYGLRSDKTVARTFDLDPEKDKEFIKKIKRDQMIATLPGALIPSVGGIFAYLYCKNQDTSKIDVE